MSPNNGATNETGFTALPGGYRGSNGTFNNVNDTGNWWSATELSTDNVWIWNMNYSGRTINRDYDSKEVGFSVRCVKD